MAHDAILFDLDETLLADQAGTTAALLATSVFATLHYDIEASALVRSAWQYACQLWATSPERAYCEDIGISAGEGLWGRFMGDDQHLQALAAWAPIYQRQTWEYALAEHSIVDDSLARLLAMRFRDERRARHQLFPETEAVLRQLQPAYPLALVTNGAPDIQRDKIAGSHIAHFFEAIVVSGELGIGKPAATIFAHALSLLGREAAQALMVGDSLTRDIQGAQGAGIRAVWICRTDTPRQPTQIVPDATISSLGQLPALLEV